MKKKGLLICVCTAADNNCSILCPKGRKLDPDIVYNYPKWKQGIKQIPNEEKDYATEL